MNCRVCGIELTDDNWKISSIKKHDYICIVCKRKIGKEDYHKQKEKKLEQKRVYYQNNREKILENKRDYYIDNKDIIDNKHLEYNKTPGGKRVRKTSHIRGKSMRRGLGLIPLNLCKIDGWEGHHIDKEYIIYIPRELHRSISHNIFTGKNMDEINFIVLQWYVLYYWMA